LFYRKSLHVPHILGELLSELVGHPWLSAYSHLLLSSPTLLSLLSPSSLARDPRRALLQGILEPLR